MKILKCLPVLMVLMVVSCVAQKSKINYDEIIYSASTRGVNIEIKVKDGTLTYKNNDEEEIIELSSNDKKDLYNKISALHLGEMKNLKAPSEKRITDAALHGEMLVKFNGEEFKSSPFDYGNAPKELKPLEIVLFRIAKIEE